MAPNPTIMQAVEQLDYRVTNGDVAAKAGLDVKIAEKELLALASDAGGHLQVADTGDLVYLFPKDFRAVLRNKFLRLQLQEWWEKIWRVLFYLIRISFGIVLIVSIVLIFVTIFIIVTASSNRDDNGGGGRSRSGGGGMIFMPNFWYWGDLFWFFDPNYGRTHHRRQERYQRRQGSDRDDREMNFLEAVFSFLFGDGNPNADLEERRWQAIATVIRNHGSAVAGEQIAPYLDEATDDYEEYMLPVLTRFNGVPQVSPDGEIVYHFPELQITAAQTDPQPVSAYLKELPWQFSQASSGQNILSAGLGGLNLVGALMLGSLLKDGAIAQQIGGLVAFVDSIYWLLLGYGAAFLTVPLIRYFWIQWRNQKIEANNQQRQERAIALNQADSQLLQKLAYAENFAAQNVITSQDLAYSTETDLIEQEFEQSAKLDAEWQRKLEGNP